MGRVYSGVGIYLIIAVAFWATVASIAGALIAVFCAALILGWWWRVVREAAQLGDWGLVAWLTVPASITVPFAYSQAVNRSLQAWADGLDAPGSQAPEWALPVAMGVTSVLFFVGPWMLLHAHRIFIHRRLAKRWLRADDGTPGLVRGMTQAQMVADGHTRAAETENAGQRVLARSPMVSLTIAWIAFGVVDATVLFQMIENW